MWSAILGSVWHVPHIIWVYGPIHGHWHEVHRIIIWGGGFIR